MWEEATYLCVHTCRGKLFTKPIPSYNLESLVAAWICSDPCCHQQRERKKKGKTPTTHLFKHCQKMQTNTFSLSQKEKKTKQLATHPVYREHVPQSGIQGEILSSQNKMQPSTCEVEAVLQCKGANVKPQETTALEIPVKSLTVQMTKLLFLAQWVFRKLSCSMHTNKKWWVWFQIESVTKWSPNI